MAKPFSRSLFFFWTQKPRTLVQRMRSALLACAVALVAVSGLAEADPSIVQVGGWVACSFPRQRRFGPRVVCKVGAGGVCCGCVCVSVPTAHCPLGQIGSLVLKW